MTDTAKLFDRLQELGPQKEQALTERIRADNAYQAICRKEEDLWREIKKAHGLK